MADHDQREVKHHGTLLGSFCPIQSPVPSADPSSTLIVSFVCCVSSDVSIWGELLPVNLFPSVTMQSICPSGVAYTDPGHVPKHTGPLRLNVHNGAGSIATAGSTLLVHHAIPIIATSRRNSQ